MANPFGGSDESLSKNTGHANQANLVYAWIPRSSTKIVEVINAQTINPAGGNYDADGYWRFNSTTRTENAFAVSGESAGDARTVIVGARYNSAGDVNISIGEFAGLFKSGEATVNRFLIRLYRYARNVNAFVVDNGGGSAAGLNGSLPDPGDDTFGAAVKHNGTNAQSCLYRVGSTTTQIGSDTFTGLSDSDNGLNRVGVWSGTKYAYQYIFVYNAALSDADINAIIDNPGGVISTGGAANQVVKVERGRGVGRGLGRGIF